MKVIELKAIISGKLGIAMSEISAEDFRAYGVRFRYHGSMYRATTDLTIEKVDGAYLVTDDDTRQLENILRGEEWDGEGMPPIGSKVSFFYNERYDYHKEIIPEHGQELEVVAHKTTTDGHDVAVCYWDKSGGGMAVCLVPGSLLPIRSEEEKKRDEAIAALKQFKPQLVGHLAGYLYDEIAEGKIPHIRIE